MAPRSGLPAGVASAIDFQTYLIPAEQGMNVPHSAIAAMLDITVEQYEDHVAQAQREVEAVAQNLLSRPENASAIDRIPVAPGETVMALGDSVTAYRKGYAEVLRAMIAARRSGDDVKVDNRACPGFTSAHARRNIYYTQLHRRRPALVLLMLGGNDCMLFGGAGARTLISLHEYRENVRDIIRAFREQANAQVVVISPVPVVESVVQSVANFRSRQLTWANADLQACADALRELTEEDGLPFVDLMRRFGPEPDRSLFGVDGVHPGPSGHRVIVEELLKVEWVPR